jgi:hypothetical protein
VSPVPTAAATTANTASAPTTTAGALSSPPQYRSIPSLEIAQVIAGRGLDGPAATEAHVAPGSPMANSSPRKRRVLSPQPKPRPPSQLFTAPPDFSNQSSENPAREKTATVQPLPQPGAAGTGAADARPPNSDGSEGQQ